MVNKIDKQRQEGYYYFRTSEAINDYYRQFEKIHISNETYKMWLESFKLLGRGAPDKKSLELASKDLNFKRFALELNDYGLLDFLKDHLPKYIYKKWYRTEYIEGMDVV